MHTFLVALIRYQTWRQNGKWLKQACFDNQILKNECDAENAFEKQPFATKLQVSKRSKERANIFSLSHCTVCTFLNKSYLFARPHSAKVVNCATSLYSILQCNHISDVFQLVQLYYLVFQKHLSLFTTWTQLRTMYIVVQYILEKERCTQCRNLLKQVP